jgi:hypothetical protein
MDIYLDIETIKSSRNDLAEFFKAKQKPPAKMSVKATIDKWWLEKADSEIIEKISKTSLSGDYGEIISISFAVGEGEIFNVYRYPGDAETVILDLFWRTLDAELDLRKATRWIGFNHLSFDMPFVAKRAIITGAQLPDGFPMHSKAWDKNVFDVMVEWAGFGNRISQDELCFILGIDGKPSDITGANVGQHYIDGHHEKIIDYNNDDVNKLRQIHKRMKAVL